MLSLRRPRPQTVERVLAAARRAPLSYAPAGLTDGAPLPAGFDLDRYRRVLGRGEATLAAARAALASWAMFGVGWARLHPPAPPRTVGTVVAVEARAWGMWTLSPCRVVATIDDEVREDGRTLTRHGFAYGTLAGHLERGEERFLVHAERGGGEVTFEILAVSRPAHPLLRLAYPLARHAQRRFGRDALAAMHRAVAAAGGGSGAAPGALH